MKVNALWRILYYIVVVIIERDGIRYRKTTVEVREDLLLIARERKWNMAATLNKALEERVRKEED